jgi:hypothetical protein
MQQMQQPLPTKDTNGVGLGFIVEKLLNDFDNDGENDNVCNEFEKEYAQYEKKYDEIKQTILAIYKKIKQRKNYNSNGVTVSYMNYSKVKEQYRELLNLLYVEKENNETKHRANWHIVMLHRLLAHTRDISDGCGERELAYMQLFELARMNAAAASHALETVVTWQSDKPKPLGSWKDVKGLVGYMRRTMNMRDERDMAAYLALTNYAVRLVNERLAKDVLAFYKDDDEIIGHGNKDDDEIIGHGNKDDDEIIGHGNKDDGEISFVSKWIPRENKSKKYGNFYERLACDYYKDWLPKDRNANPVSYEKAVVKCKIHYRKLVSFLNQYLETPQIKMCQKRWSDIAFSKTTRLTRDLQDRALLNLKSHDHRTKRHVGNADREACAEKYKVWKCDTINRANGINTDLETHVAVSKYYSSCSSLDYNRNAEWAAFASQEVLKNRFKRAIPVLAGNSYKAVGLALAVAENALTGRTLIVKDGGELVLHDLDASFVKNVKYLTTKAPQWRGEHLHSVCGHPMYKCLISALKLLIESNVATKDTRHSEDRGCGFTVTIFADDDSSGMFNDDVSFKEVLNEASLLYREFGYGVPNVVLWAMASTVCHENHNNNDMNNNNSNNDTGAVVYKSVSYGGALTIQVGCDASEICAYLGVENKKKEWKHHNNMWHADQRNEWQNEWNHLVEMLYNRRYYPFEQYYWKNTYKK